MCNVLYSDRHSLSPCLPISSVSLYHPQSPNLFCLTISSLCFFISSVSLSPLPPSLSHYFLCLSVYLSHPPVSPSPQLSLCLSHYLLCQSAPLSPLSPYLPCLPISSVSLSPHPLVSQIGKSIWRNAVPSLTATPPSTGHSINTSHRDPFRGIERKSKNTEKHEKGIQKCFSVFNCPPNKAAIDELRNLSPPFKSVHVT